MHRWELAWRLGCTIFRCGCIQNTSKEQLWSVSIVYGHTRRAVVDDCRSFLSKVHTLQYRVDRSEVSGSTIIRWMTSNVNPEDLTNRNTGVRLSTGDGLMSYVSGVAVQMLAAGDALRPDVN